jgi:hypothetical protein
MLVAHCCSKPYRSLVKSYGEPLHHRGYQLVCVIERPARNQSVACSTVIGNLPISDSENEGVMGSKIAATLSIASASWLSRAWAPTWARLALAKYHSSPDQSLQAPHLLSAVQLLRHLFPSNNRWHLH